MRILLFILVIPVIEIALFVQIGSHIGVIGTLALVFLSAAAGLVLMRLEPHRNAQDVRAALAQDTSPASPMAHSALRMIGATLLLAPGFFTDALGLLLMLPPLRRVLLSRLLTSVQAGHTRSDTVIIEGDFERHPDTSPPTDRLPRQEKQD